MRKLFTLFTLVVSTSLFASPFCHECSTTYGGEGEWKALCGGSGTFEATLSFTHQKMTAYVTVGGTSYSYTLGKVNERNGFFEVVNADDLACSRVVGWGHCFGNVCHYTAKVHGWSVEETFYFDNGNMLYTSGSKYLANSYCDKNHADDVCGCQVYDWRSKLGNLSR